MEIERWTNVSSLEKSNVRFLEKKIQYWTLMLAGHKHKHIYPTCDVKVQLMLGFYFHVNFNIRVEPT